jgi:hypothetical protein
MALAVQPQWSGWNLPDLLLLKPVFGHGATTVDSVYPGCRHYRRRAHCIRAEMLCRAWLCD